MNIKKSLLFFILLASHVTHTQTPLEQFLAAAKAGNVEVIDTCLKEGTVGINAKDDQGNTALHLAATNGHRPVISRLLEGQKDVGWWDAWWYGKKLAINEKNNNGDTALHCAARNGHDQVITELAWTGNANIEEQNKAGVTPLIEAVKMGKKNAACSLLPFTENYYTQDGGPANILHIATQENHLDMISLFAQDKKLINVREKNGLTPLLIAIRLNSPERVDILLKNKADANLPSFKNGASPLHLAAEKGKKAILDNLINYKAFLDATDKQGKTALRWAVDADNSSSIRYLAGCGANINLADNTGYTPLHAASENNNKNNTLTDLLSQKTIIIDCKDQHGNTPLIIAAQKDNVLALDLLLRKGADLYHTNQNNQSAFSYAVKKPQLLALIKKHPHFKVDTVDKDNRTQFMIAALNGDMVTIQQLRQLGANTEFIDAFGQTALHLAAHNDNKEMIPFLITTNRKLLTILDKKNNNPLLIALQNKQKKNAALLIEHGSSVTSANSFGNTALHEAAIFGDASLTSLILKKGAIINQKNNQDNAPLHLAVKTKDFDTINMLLANNAHCDIRNKQEETPLILATQLNSHAVANLFLHNNADVNLADCDGYTAVAYAAQNDYVSLLDTLYQHGALLNKANNDGNTPAHLAAAKGNLSTIKYLISKDAQLDKQNKYGQNTFMISVASDQPTVVDFFINQFNYTPDAIEFALRYAKSTHAYRVNSCLEKFKQQRITECSQITQAQSIIIELIEENKQLWYGKLLGKTDTSHMQRYVPSISESALGHTYNNLIALYPEQRNALIKTLNHHIQQERQYKTYAEQKLRELATAEQKVTANCEQILRAQDTTTDLITNNKKYLEEIKKIEKDPHAVPSYTPSSCHLHYTLEKLMSYNPTERNKIISTLLQCQSHESHNKTRLEQALKEIAHKETAQENIKEASANANANADVNDDDDYCFISCCGENPGPLRSMPCNCKTQRICQDCLDQYVAKYGDTCPTCHGGLKGEKK